MRHILFAFLLIPLLFSCESFPFEDYTYTLDSLVLGMAYPPVKNAADRDFTLGHLETLGVEDVRMGTNWSDREPSRDTFAWRALNERLQAFNSAGISVLLTLETHNWPDWLDLAEGKGAANVLTEFREYVAALLEECGEQMAYIQLGNEWNWEIDSYFEGNEDTFIAYSRIVSDEVEYYRTRTGRMNPEIVLGSFAARQALVLDRDGSGQIIIEGESVRENRIASYLALPEEERMTRRVTKVLSETDFEWLDIHFYDDFTAWEDQWEAFVEVYEAVLPGEEVPPLLASEWGGPYPTDLYAQLGIPSRKLLAKRLLDYTAALDALPVEKAYFFKLREDPSVYHSASYLVDLWGGTTPAYEVFRRLAE